MCFSPFFNFFKFLNSIYKFFFHFKHFFWFSTLVRQRFFFLYCAIISIKFSLIGSMQLFIKFNFYFIIFPVINTKHFCFSIGQRFRGFLRQIQHGHARQLTHSISLVHHLLRRGFFKGSDLTEGRKISHVAVARSEW